MSRLMPTHLPGFPLYIWVIQNVLSPSVYQISSILLMSFLTSLLSRGHWCKQWGKQDTVLILFFFFLPSVCSFPLSFTCLKDCQSQEWLLGLNTLLQYFCFLFLVSCELIYRQYHQLWQDQVFLCKPGSEMTGQFWICFTTPMAFIIYGTSLV